MTEQEVFEIDGIWYVEVDHGPQLPRKHQRMAPQPSEVGKEYRHADGNLHVCKNPLCPNLVPRSKNPGVPRYYCTRQCGKADAGRKHDAKRGERRKMLYDPLERLYAVVWHRPKSTDVAGRLLSEHADGTNERCPQANEASNFVCPGVYNPNCYSEIKWQTWHETGRWPGACLIFATLKDHKKVCYYQERGQTTERDYTRGQGEHWRWKEEEAMLPMPEGIIRP